MRTSAQPLVEITVMRQPSRQRLLVHFVDLSGAIGGWACPVKARIRPRTVTIDWGFMVVFGSHGSGVYSEGSH